MLPQKAQKKSKSFVVHICKSLQKQKF